jgi:hypothetical protein
MIFESFGYKGHFVFTQPLTFQNQNEDLLIIATPYGDSGSLENALSEFLNEFEGQSEDLDSTSPYPKLTCLSSEENLLFTSVQFLNDFIYSNHNKQNFNLACDFFCVYKKNKSLFTTQIGWPITLLHSNNTTHPLTAEYSFAPKNKQTAPFIPSGLLGLESSINVKIQQITVEDNAEILLLKSNESPDTLMTTYPNTLDSIANVYASENPEQGFWLGKISL